MRKTKIICTMGPSTDKEGILEQLAIEGMDVARFNFSHGPHEEQKGRLERLKAIRSTDPLLRCSIQRDRKSGFRNLKKARLL